jgi:hypothetical protein
MYSTSSPSQALHGTNSISAVSKITTSQLLGQFCSMNQVATTSERAGLQSLTRALSRVTNCLPRRDSQGLRDFDVVASSILSHPTVNLQDTLHGS